MGRSRTMNERNEKKRTSPSLGRPPPPPLGCSWGRDKKTMATVFITGGKNKTIKPSSSRRYAKIQDIKKVR